MNNNEQVRQYVEEVLAGKIWHFRELFDIDGSPEEDKKIAWRFWKDGIRRTHRIYRELMDYFHDDLQKKCLVEEDEKAKERIPA
jgi:hypothetical protein